MNTSRKIMGLLDGLDDVNESITLSWRKETSWSSKWTELVAEKYSSIFGKFLGEKSFGGKNACWVLIFEKASLAGVTTSKTSGEVKWYSSAAGKEVIKGRPFVDGSGWLRLGNIAFFPIPDEVKSTKQLVNAIDFQSEMNIKRGSDMGAYSNLGWMIAYASQTHGYPSMKEIDAMGIPAPEVNKRWKYINALNNLSSGRNAATIANFIFEPTPLKKGGDPVAFYEECNRLLEGYLKKTAGFVEGDDGQ